MKITIEFDTEKANCAYWEANWASEIDRIMANVINNVHDAILCSQSKNAFNTDVVGVNGNKIGSVKIKI